MQASTETYKHTNPAVFCGGAAVADYYGADNDNYVAGEGFCCGDNNLKTKSIADDSPNYEKLQYYYHSDHLGSASYITNLDGEVVQHIEYVPFGEVFLEERNNTWNTPFLFNGKELDEETGLYYYGARYYNPRISLWYGVDPLAEKYPAYSPYCYTMNNPIMLIDPDGREASTHTDEDGNVIAVYDDGDNEVYRHKGNKDDVLKNLNENYSSSTPSAGGEKMGESLHSLSFADQNLYNQTGKVISQEIKIDFASTELTDAVQSILDGNPSLLEYGSKAGTSGDWDLKYHFSNGSKLFGKYASPRDGGNFTAGAVAEMSGFESIAQFGYGAYNLTGNSKIKTGLLTGTVSSLILINPALGSGLGYLIGKFGEDKLTQRSIDIGKQYIKSNK